MAHKVYKHRLPLDEGFHLPARLPMLNRRFDLKHVAEDFKQTGITDEQVYALARKEHRLLVTYNLKDFLRRFHPSRTSGILGISPNLSLEQTDKRLTALLMRSGPKQLYGKVTTITGEAPTQLTSQ